MIRKLLGRVENDSFPRSLVLLRNLLLAVAQDIKQEEVFQFTKERVHVSIAARKIILSKIAPGFALEDPNHKDKAINKRLCRLECLHSPQTMLR